MSIQSLKWYHHFKCFLLSFNSLQSGKKSKTARIERVHDVLDVKSQHCKGKHMPAWQEIKGKWTHLAAVDHMTGLKWCYFSSWWTEPLDYSTEGMVALLVYQQRLEITSALDGSQNSAVKTKGALGQVALVYVQVCFEATLILQLHLVLWMMLILTFIHSFRTNERSATTANVNMSSHAGRDEEQNSGLSL